MSGLSKDITDWASSMGTVDGKGSNNWVVAGNRSASGKPLLANDPHLGLSAPAIWYFAHLEAPASKAEDDRVTPAVKAIGATLPGLPFVVLGGTAKIAWGFTSTLPDVQDLYLEKFDDLEVAFSTYHSPMQSVVMACVTGRTTFKAVGKLPLRKLENDILGIAPSPGCDARYDWAGWVPYAGQSNSDQKQFKSDK